MAANDELERMKRIREKREQEDTQDEEKPSGPAAGTRTHIDVDLLRESSPTRMIEIAKQDDSEKMNTLMQQAQILMDQLNHLYNMYVAGTEHTPPIQKRAQLDNTMAGLQAMGKFTATDQFRFSSLQAGYNANKDRWDKLLRDIESGKVKRAFGVNRR